MNQLRVKNKTLQNNQAQTKSLQFQAMPNEENNNIFSENDEYCYELDQSTYSNISNSNKSRPLNNSNTIQMISELSENQNELPLEYINHIQVNKSNSSKRNIIKKDQDDQKEEEEIYDSNNTTKNNNYHNNVTLNNLNTFSDNNESNDINMNSNNENNDNEIIDNENLDNEWNIPKITFSEISKVSKAMSSEANECDNDYSNSNINNINNMNIIQENLNIKKNLKKYRERESENDNILESNNNYHNLLHKKNIESKFSTEDNGKTINLLSSQYSNMDFLKQTINNCLIKSGYKDIIDNSQKILAKSSSLDFLNENSNIKPENEKIKKNLIMQMVLFTNMKNEMEMLKKDNDDLVNKVKAFKKEKINNDQFKSDMLNEIKSLRNKIKKYKDNGKNYDNLKKELRNLIKKNDQLIKNNNKIITENKELKDELIKLKKMKKEFLSGNEKSNDDKEKKDLINKLNIIIKENRNLSEILDKKNSDIKDLEKTVNTQKIDINNYIEKIKILQDKNDIINNNKNKRNNNYKITDEQNQVSKVNKLLFLNLYDINNNIKNTNNENNININDINNNYKKSYFNSNNINSNNITSTYNIDFFKSKLQEKNNIIEKLQLENLNLIHLNESKEKQIKELLNIKSEYNTIETQNNELKNEINELNLKYTELINENNTNNDLIKNNLLKQINKLNSVNKEKENELFSLTIKKEKMKKKIVLSYNTLIDFSKKVKIYANKEFNSNNMNLFLQGFKELIENLNSQKFEQNLDELKAIESICDFINLIPLEIEILYKRILSIQKDYDNIALNTIKNDPIINTEKNKIYNKNIDYLNTYTDIPLNKKMSKYKTNENSLYFRNKQIKIKKLNITELTNSVNNSIKKFVNNSKNKINLEENDDQRDNQVLKKCNTNLHTETIKSSRSDNLELKNKISPYRTIKSNKDTIQKGVNLKKFPFNKNGEEKKGSNSSSKKRNNLNVNISNINNNNLVKERNMSENQKSTASNIIYKNYNKNKGNITNNTEFKLVKAKIKNTGFKLRKNVKNDLPQKILNIQNEEKCKNNTLNVNEKYLKSETSLTGMGNVANYTQNAYKRKISHKINNFSVNIKGNKKNKISFSSSISSGKKKNNSSLIIN